MIQLLGRFGMIILRFLPLDITATCMGLLVAWVGPFISISKRMHTSIHTAFPQMEDKQIRLVIHQCWKNLGRSIVELAHWPSIFFRGRRKRVHFTINPAVEAYLADWRAGRTSRPFIALTMHISAVKIGIMPFITEDLNKEIGFVYHIDGLTNHIFSYIFSALGPVGQYVIPLSNRKSFAQASTFLEKGLGVAFLADKKIRSGVPVTFFHRTVYMTHLAALLALKHDAVIIPVWSFRKDGKSLFEATTGEMIIPNLDAPSTEEIQRITQSIATYIETQVRRSPAEWLWMTQEVIGLFK